MHKSLRNAHLISITFTLNFLNQAGIDKHIQNKNKMSAFTALNGGSPKTAASSGDKSIKSHASDEEETQSRKSPNTSDSLRRDSCVERLPLPSEDLVNADVNHKRQRSLSVSTASPSRSAHTPEATPIRPLSKTRKTTKSPPRDIARQFKREGRDQDVSWPTRPDPRTESNGYDDQQNSVSPPPLRHGQTENQVGDALQLPSGQQDHSDCTNTSPDAEDQSVANFGSPYEGEQRQDSVLHHDPKKRKRNFSNRTKTGCFTCRRRKKKCDEQKPECELVTVRSSSCRLFRVRCSALDSSFLADM